MILTLRRRRWLRRHWFDIVITVIGGGFLALWVVLTIMVVFLGDL